MLFFDYFLNNVLQQYNEIIVYGTGQFATKLYPMLCKNNLKEKILSFAESTINEQKQFEDFEVKEIDEIQCNKEKVVVLTAVSELYENEVVENARSLGFKNIIRATDYIRSDNNIKKFYYGMNYTDFIKHILGRHVYDFPIEKNICKIMEGRLLESLEQQSFDDNQIVFITGHLSSRNIKMINALRKKGYSVITIIYCVYRQEIFEGEIQRKEITYIECGDEDEMMFHALKYRPLVYFYDPLWGNCTWMEIMLQYKTYLRPIVLGLYDVLNDNYIMDNVSLLESERYALENADGVVWRYFSKEYLEEKKGFTYKGKSILFHDYCGGYLQEKSEIECQKNDVLKLCCVWGDYKYFPQENDVPNGYIAEATIKDIANVLGNKENVIFHIYIAVSDLESMKEVEEIENRYSNIRFFWNIVHDELIEKLQWYDYGCEFYNEGRIIPMDMPVKCGNCTFYGSAYINSVANRYFDYIDAGLPIVISAPYKQIEFLSKYDVIVRMSLQSFNIDFLKENVIDLKKKVVIARHKLNIDNHIQELIDFFMEC